MTTDHHEENYDWQILSASEEVDGELSDDQIDAFESKLKELLGDRHAGELTDEESLVLVRAALVAIGLRVVRR